MLAHYYDLENGSEYYTTAKEVAVWVEDTQAAASRAQAPALGSAAPAQAATRDRGRLRQMQRVSYYA